MYLTPLALHDPFRLYPVYQSFTKPAQLAM
jgi:hypothetical protein